MNKDSKFSKPPTQESKFIPDFSLQPDSLAIDAGVNIPGFTDDFKGKAPDIGSYERGAAIWKAGSTLEYTLEKNN